MEIFEKLVSFLIILFTFQACGACVTMVNDNPGSILAIVVIAIVLGIFFILPFSVNNISSVDSLKSSSKVNNLNKITDKPIQPNIKELSSKTMTIDKSSNEWFQGGVTILNQQKNRIINRYSKLDLLVNETFKTNNLTEQKYKIVINNAVEEVLSSLFTMNENFNYYDIYCPPSKQCISQFNNLINKIEDVHNCIDKIIDELLYLNKKRVNTEKYSQIEELASITKKYFIDNETYNKLDEDILDLNKSYLFSNNTKVNWYVGKDKQLKNCADELLRKKKSFEGIVDRAFSNSQITKDKYISTVTEVVDPLIELIEKYQIAFLAFEQDKEPSDLRIEIYNSIINSEKIIYNSMNKVIDEIAKYKAENNLKYDTICESLEELAESTKYYQ